MVYQATDDCSVNARNVNAVLLRKYELNVDCWLVVKACYVFRLQTQVKLGTRIIYYCIVKLLLCKDNTKKIGFTV